MTVYKYSIYCQTEGVTVAGWTDDPPPPIGTGPVVCPNNNAHAVTAASVFELDQVSTATVKIDQKVTKPYPGQSDAGDRHETVCVNVVAAANSTGYADYMSALPVYIEQFDIHQATENLDDDVSICIGDLMDLGTLTTAVTAGVTTIIGINADAMAYAVVGFFLFADNGDGNKVEIGRVKSLDKVNNQVTVVANVSPISFDVGDIMCFGTKPLQSHCMRYVGVYEVGNAVIGGYYIMPNTVVRIYYTNKDPLLSRMLSVGINIRF